MRISGVLKVSGTFSEFCEFCRFLGVLEGFWELIQLLEVLRSFEKFWEFLRVRSDFPVVILHFCDPEVFTKRKNSLFTNSPGTGQLTRGGFIIFTG